MRVLIFLMIGFTLSGCAIKFGDVKKGGAIEYFETHYTTKMRGSMPGGAVLLTMDTYLSPMVVQYCSLRQGEIVSVWCVDKNKYPLFKVKYSGPSDVPLMVNGKITMFSPYPLLEIIERNNTISDQAWLDSAKTRWGLSPDTLTEVR